MNLLLKTTLKNTFGKPLRTIVVVFSIFVCTLAAMFCFDLSKTMMGLLEISMSEIRGEADLGISAYINDLDELPDELPEYRALILYNLKETMYDDIEGEYYIVTTSQLNVVGLDLQAARDMSITKLADINVGEVVVTDKYAEKYGLTAGDVISLHDKAGDLHDFKIREVAVADGKNILLRGMSAVVNEEDARMLLCNKDSTTSVLIDVFDDGAVKTAEEMLKEEYGKDNVIFYGLDETTNSYLGELYGLLFILFAVTFLLVIFVTASICERIVSERMSFIGTLRSLGMSTTRTIRILLAENVAYAVIGCVPALILYICIRTPMLDSMFDVSSSGLSEEIKLTIPGLSVPLVIAVLISAVVIECLIPLKSILRAMKTSIRDIIFDNRDTEYKPSKKNFILGFVFLFIGVAASFGKPIVCVGIAMIALVLALALLYPLILIVVSKLLSGIAEKFGFEKMLLAVREAVSRKSTVGSGVLCATASAMCIIIVILSGGMSDVLDNDTYDCDVIVNVTDMSKYFSFVPHLDGVTDTEFIYQRSQYVCVGDDETQKISQVFGLPEGGFKYYMGLQELPDSLEPGSICLERTWASSRGYGVGDTVKITFDPDGVFPIEKEFKVASVFKINAYDSYKNDFVIAQSEFIDMFHDKPGMLLVRTDDPEGTRDTIKKYAVGRYSDVKTRQEIAEQNEKDNATSKLIYGIVIAIAIVMTFLGMVSNQTIGFEGRKKECAVMISTSMTKKTLAGILFREMLITSFVSSTAGTALAIALFGLVKKAIDSSESVFLPLEWDYSIVVELWIMMTLVFTLSVLFPVKHMRKMKLAEQLKYE